MHFKFGEIGQSLSGVPRERRDEVSGGQNSRKPQKPGKIKDDATFDTFRGGPGS
jgi:hypothetical protein